MRLRLGSPHKFVVVFPTSSLFYRDMGGFLSMSLTIDVTHLEASDSNESSLPLYFQSPRDLEPI